jgi:hypothetical protein
MTMKTAIVGLGFVFAFGLAASARADTVTGEVIDTFCYSSMGAKGASHKQCGIDCVKKGIPAGLLEKGTDKVYVLLPAKDKEPLPAGLVEKMGSDVTVTGKVHATGGSQFLTVESFK